VWDRRAWENKRGEQERIRSGKPLIICALDGTKLRTMGSHLYHRHRMSAREYTLSCKLPLGTKLAAPDIREILRARALASGAMSPKRQARLHAGLEKFRADPERWAVANQRQVESHRIRPPSTALLLAGRRVARRNKVFMRGLEVLACPICGRHVLVRKSAHRKYCSLKCAAQVKSDRQIRWARQLHRLNATRR